MSLWFTKTPAETLSELETNQTSGLTSAEAEARLEKYGPNALEVGKKESLIVRFLKQMWIP